MNKKNDQLEDNDNKRLKAYRPTKNEGTAAYAEQFTKQEHSQVSIPSEENVIEAKKWVDNGSKL